MSSDGHNVDVMNGTDLNFWTFLVGFLLCVSVCDAGCVEMNFDETISLQLLKDHIFQIKNFTCPGKTYKGEHNLLSVIAMVCSSLKANQKFSSINANEENSKTNDSREKVIWAFEQILQKLANQDWKNQSQIKEFCDQYTCQNSCGSSYINVSEFKVIYKSVCLLDVNNTVCPQSEECGVSPSQSPSTPTTTTHLQSSSQSPSTPTTATHRQSSSQSPSTPTTATHRQSSSQLPSTPTTATHLQSSRTPPVQQTHTDRLNTSSVESTPSVHQNDTERLRTTSDEIFQRSDLAVLVLLIILAVSLLFNLGLFLKLLHRTSHPSRISEDGQCLRNMQHGSQEQLEQSPNRKMSHDRSHNTLL